GQILGDIFWHVAACSSDQYPHMTLRYWLARSWIRCGASCSPSAKNDGGVNVLSIRRARPSRPDSWALIIISSAWKPCSGVIIGLVPCWIHSTKCRSPSVHGHVGSVSSKICHAPTLFCH